MSLFSDASLKRKLKNPAVHNRLLEIAWLPAAPASQPITDHPSCYFRICASGQESTVNSGIGLEITYEPISVCEFQLVTWTFCKFNNFLSKSLIVAEIIDHNNDIMAATIFKEFWTYVTL